MLKINLFLLLMMFSMFLNSSNQIFDNIQIEINLYQNSIDAHFKCTLCNLVKVIKNDQKYCHMKKRLDELQKFKDIFNFKKDNCEKASLLLEQLEKMNKRQSFKKHVKNGELTFGYVFYTKTKTLLNKYLQENILHSVL